MDNGVVRPIDLVDASAAPDFNSLKCTHFQACWQAALSHVFPTEAICCPEAPPAPPAGPRMIRRRQAWCGAHSSVVLILIQSDARAALRRRLSGLGRP